MLEHTKLLNQQRDAWINSGRDVYVEGQNAFRLRGKLATLAVRPDLLAVNGNDVLIIDTKSGREQPWHHVQMMIYQYALPRAFPQYRNAQMGGEIIYQSYTVRVPRGALPQQFIEGLGCTTRRQAADTPPKRVPSAAECRFCDITAADCPERVEDGDQTVDETTDEF